MSDVRAIMFQTIVGLLVCRTVSGIEGIGLRSVYRFCVEQVCIVAVSIPSRNPSVRPRKMAQYTSVWGSGHIMIHDDIVDRNVAVM